MFKKACSMLVSPKTDGFCIFPVQTFFHSDFIQIIISNFINP